MIKKTFPNLVTQCRCSNLGNLTYMCGAAINIIASNLCVCRLSVIHWGAKYNRCQWKQVNSLAPWRSECESKNLIFLFYWLVSWDLCMIMTSGECHRTLLMIRQLWFWQWLGAIKQQAITWTSVDQDVQRHMASLGPNELRCIIGVALRWEESLSDLQN